MTPLSFFRKPFRATAELSLEEKIGQMMMIGFSGTSLPAHVRGRLATGKAGFVLLFYHNVESVEQVVDLTNDIHASHSPAPMIWTDQEGGNVVQFKEIAATALSPMGMAATGRCATARRAGHIIGGEMKALGVDGVFAPVLDVNTQADNPIIGFRSFSDDPRVVARFGHCLAKGLRRGGVAACGKHFPGHGGVLVDSHRTLPRFTADSDTLDTVHIKPFRDLIRARLLDAVMPAHVVYPGKSTEIASLSPYWLGGVLRGGLGFPGLIISDCLEMGAVAGSLDPGTAALRAVRAGADVISVSRSSEIQEIVFNTLLAAAGRGELAMSRVDESVKRILEFKRDRGLLQQVPRVDPRRALRSARSHYDAEFRMAVDSVTLARDRDGDLPLDSATDLLVVEWKKAVATEALSQARARSVLAAPLNRRFRQVNTVMLELEPRLPEYLSERLLTAGKVVAAVFSRSPQTESIQAAAVREILNLRPDAIVVALGNPYDLRKFPEARVYLAVYGYRKVQAEALAAVLAGAARPGGKLPVRIPGVALIS